ncbi:MAG: hypothetical protein WCK11_05765 [Candidatus Falkowbacteria bacterium]
MRLRNTIKKNLVFGFSLLEIITVIFIVSVGLVALISLNIATMRNFGSLKTGTAVFYLAQEGIELVRGIRDRNWTAGRNWLAGFNTTTPNFVLDYTRPDGADYPLGNVYVATFTDNESILYMDANGYLRQGQGLAANPSIYRRVVYLSNITATSTEVTSRVSAKEGDKTKYFEIKTKLYDFH